MAVITDEEAGGKGLAAFLDLIAFSEGTSTSEITQDNGYDIIVSGVDGHHRLFDYDDHPFAPQYKRKPIVVRESPLLLSTASGRYQVLCHYFEVYKEQLHLPDFSPLSQDKVALQQMRERGAINLVVNGDIAGAIKACSNIWASFPGNDYSQPGGKTLEALVSQYQPTVA